MPWLLAVWLFTAPPADGAKAVVVEAVVVENVEKVEKVVVEKVKSVKHVDESGVASFYARSFEGRKTASGELYQGSAATCAHRTHPFGTRLRVTLVKSGRSALCVVNDRGPFQKNRVLDVSRSVAVELGLVRRGVGTVRITVVPPL